MGGWNRIVPSRHILSYCNKAAPYTYMYMGGRGEGKACLRPPVHVSHKGGTRVLPPPQLPAVLLSSPREDYDSSDLHTFPSLYHPNLWLLHNIVHVHVYVERERTDLPE